MNNQMYNETIKELKAGTDMQRDGKTGPTSGNLAGNGIMFSNTVVPPKTAGPGAFTFLSYAVWLLFPYSSLLYVVRIISSMNVACFCYLSIWPPILRCIVLQIFLAILEYDFSFILLG